MRQDSLICRTVVLDGPIALAHVVGPMRRGTYDPCFRLNGGQAVWATNTPEGPGSIHLQQVTEDTIEVDTHGSGSQWLADRAPALLGADDNRRDFMPTGVVAELHDRNRGLRFGRTERVIEALVPTILEQKVHSVMAYRSYRRIVKAWGTRAPGPFDLYCPPVPERLAEQPYYAFHRFEVDRKRADAIRQVCAQASQIENAATEARAIASQKLQALPEVGEWSAAEVALIALGDCDAVSVGDFHLKNWVCWNLAGEPRGDDERMLELLSPYAGHRARVVRLLLIAGTAPPRYGPRLPLRSIANQ